MSDPVEETPGVLEGVYGSYWFQNNAYDIVLQFKENVKLAR